MTSGGPAPSGAKRNGVAAPFEQRGLFPWKVTAVSAARSVTIYETYAYCNWFEDSYSTTNSNLDLYVTDPTPGGTWAAGVTPAKATGYGFDNTVIGTFYVTRGTTGAAFGKFRKVPTDSSLFGYGGGRSANVTITPTGNSTPSSYTWNRANGVWNWDATSPNWTSGIRRNYASRVS